MNEITDLSILEGIEIPTSISYALTSDKNYARILMHRNITSHSQMGNYHACPRKYLLNKYRGAAGTDWEENINFAFGHSVGAGVQSLLLTGGDINTANLNAFLAWRNPFDDTLPKKKKSLWEALLAVERFPLAELMEDWELLVLPSGKQAIELSFRLDCGNGYKHYGHIDAILRHRQTGEIAVLELKTTGMVGAEEALYANSGQALSYAIVLDTLYPGLGHYEVFYLAYSSPSREWTLMPFAKSTKDKSEWIRDLLLDHAMMDKYHELQFWPKRGESCYMYNKRCEHFGVCNMVPDEQLPVLPPEEEAEEVDFKLNLAEIVAAQQEKLA